MKLGDLVEWTSQSSGFTKTKCGKIVGIVPAGIDPKDHVPQDAGGVFFQLKNPGSPRNHDSYLIRVGKQRNLYWPLVNKLKLVTIMNQEPTVCRKCGNKLQENGTCDSCVPPVKEIA